MPIHPHRITHPSGVYWQVSLGRRYTASKRQRRYFPTRKEAVKFIVQAEEARQRMGTEAFLLPLAMRAEALVCSQRLALVGASVTEATNYFLAHHSVAKNTVTMDELREEFLKSRRHMNCRATTLSQYKSNLHVICKRFGNSDAAALTRDDIEDWLDESSWSPRTRRNYLVTLTTLMNFGVQKGICSNNPAAALERPILDDKPVEILTVQVGSSRVDLQACKLEYSIVSPK